MKSETDAKGTSMNHTYFIGSATSVFAISALRVRLWPVLATIGLGLLVILPGGFIFVLLTKHMSMQSGIEGQWVALLANHGVMLVIALVLIAWIGKVRFREFGLQWPRGRKYVWSALAWGIGFGVLMTIVDYFPQILKRIPPPENLSLAPASLGLWLVFEGLYVGPTEEIPFRGLLQTFLMQRTSGRVRLWKFDMHIAGVILALLFAFAHVTSFWTEAFWLALGQQTYAFALGILYAYWREKSGSLLAPVVGHNLSDGVEYALMFLMTWLWR
jgi:membrane protease YdiL (CAAX protease family)